MKRILSVLFATCFLFVSSAVMAVEQKPLSTETTVKTAPVKAEKKKTVKVKKVKKVKKAKTVTPAVTPATTK